MGLDPKVCYRALQTRDARFDGRFFTAVRSTGVYCRPVCPAPTPKLENCVFLPCAAAAQEAGFRPCLRCRPESSPGTPAWLGTSASVSRALRLIASGALDEGSVGELAERLGIGERHLRRLFLEHLGATPIAVAKTRRLLFAKRLLDETSLPMAEIAFAAGFSSVRRFNAAIRATYGRPPSGLRRKPAAANGSDIVLRLAYRPPFDWEALLRFLEPRAMPGVESVDDGCYRRSLSLGDVHGSVEVSPAAGEHHLLARIRLERPAPLIQVADRLRRIFDLGADPAAIARHLRRDRRLARLLKSGPGLRVPGAWDGFELAVRAVLGQQVSVAAATRLAGRLVEQYGEPLRLDPPHPSLSRVFPSPERLVDADPALLRMPGRRAAAIAGLARAVADGKLVLDGSVPLEQALDQLAALPGLGPWTAQVIAMRALQEPDAFPAGDLGLRKALGSGGRLASAARAELLAEAWRPWRGYAAMLLWNAPR